MMIRSDRCFSPHETAVKMIFDKYFVFSLHVFSHRLQISWTAADKLPDLDLNHLNHIHQLSSEVLKRSVDHIIRRLVDHMKGSVDHIIRRSVGVQ